MSKVPQHLIDEARNRGLVEGAMVLSPYGSEFIVDPVSGWRTNFDGTGVANHDGSQIYSHDMQQWATVITPAPAPEGLKEGDAVECGPAMRAAIIELAKALNLPVYGPSEDPASAKDYPNLGWERRQVVANCSNPNGDTRTWHTPEAFIAKMRVTASLPRPIMIGQYEVKREKGFIKVGCQEIPNDTVRAIAAKLIDP